MWQLPLRHEDCRAIEHPAEPGNLMHRTSPITNLGLDRKRVSDHRRKVLGLGQRPTLNRKLSSQTLSVGL